MSDSGFNGDPGRYTRREDLIPIIPWLPFKEFPGGHADHAHPDAFGAEFLIRLQGQVNLGTGGDQDDLGRMRRRNQPGCKPPG